jgi:starch synthase
MKVSIIVGGRFHAFELARELHRAGVLHRLITPYPKFKTRQWDLPNDRVVSLPLSLLLQKAADRLGGDALTMRGQALFNHLFGHQAAQHLEGSTVIHGWSGVSLPALHWARPRQIPVVLERSSSHMRVQCQLLEQEYTSLGLAWKPATPTAVVNQELQEYDLASRIAVPSLFVKRSFLGQGTAADRLIHNRFGANLKSFYPGTKQDGVFRVIYTGHLGVRKGIHYLLKGFQAAKLANAELLLVGGDTKDTPRLLATADDRVRAIGHVPQPNLVKYYQNSSVFVMASIEEGLAYVQAEAMACGLPLICTTNTGGEDLLRMGGVEPIKREGGIEEYPAGFLVPVRDSDAIATCLRWLAQDGNLLQAKRQAALTIAQRDLSWHHYGDRARASYQALVA